MVIASHELKGKIEHLKQPYVVMKSTSMASKRSSSGSEDDKVAKRTKLGMGCTSDMDVDFEQQGNYEVAGIVSSKILFDSYPKSIMKWLGFS